MIKKTAQLSSLISLNELRPAQKPAFKRRKAVLDQNQVERRQLRKSISNNCNQLSKTASGFPKYQSLAIRKRDKTSNNLDASRLNVSHPQFTSYIQYIHHFLQVKGNYKKQIKDAFAFVVPKQQQAQSTHLNKVSPVSPPKRNMLFIEEQCQRIYEKVLSLGSLINQLLQDVRFRNKKMRVHFNHIFSYSPIKLLFQKYFTYEEGVQLEAISKYVKNCLMQLAMDPLTEIQLQKALEYGQQLHSWLMIKRLQLIEKSIKKQQQSIVQTRHQLPEQIVKYKLSFKKPKGARLLQQIESIQSKFGDFSLISKNIRNCKRSMDQITDTFKL